jgi:DNA modification methylase
MKIGKNQNLKKVMNIMENKILHGDSLDLLKEIEDCTVDSIVTDPPYG